MIILFFFGGRFLVYFGGIEEKGEIVEFISCFFNFIELSLSVDV